MNKQYNVLFIDDNPINNHLNTVTIRIDNIPVHPIVFENPNLALDYLKECLQNPTDTQPFPDYLMVDYNMPPYMGGLEFVELYESLFWEDFPTKRIGILSVAVPDGTEDEILKYKSIKGIFIKPFSVEIFEKMTET